MIKICCTRNIRHKEQKIKETKTSVSSCLMLHSQMSISTGAGIQLWNQAFNSFLMTISFIRIFAGKSLLDDLKSNEFDHRKCLPHFLHCFFDYITQIEFGKIAHAKCCIRTSHHHQTYFREFM